MKWSPASLPRPVRKLLMLILAIVFGFYLLYILDGEPHNYVRVNPISSEKSEPSYARANSDGVSV